MAPSHFPQELEDYIHRLESNASNLSPHVLVASAFTAGAITALGCSRVHGRYFKRMQNSNWISPESFERKQWVKGVVTSVGDADNFRLYHTPGIGWRWPLKFRRVPTEKRDLRNQTIHIRIAGADAPEAANFGREGQPYAKESLAWLSNRILGQTVHCQLITRDQYSRTVANVVTKRRFLPGSTSLALEMLRAGCATVYEQSGAEYGSWGKEEFLKAEAEAKIARRGMWKDGVLRETPAEYKRRYAQGDTDAASTSSKNAVESSNEGPMFLLRKLMFWR
ncbi:hypothetical protein GYMLUDRAFT_46065 [Collybiopsis luxurians FD-317 M1]|uniref:TNase-like domain-containing protein n=1 Tax=Collybiopsis luxurians FD-317 M1 TaxID=944289 RepID=A0A0D0B2V1_9AGAR|nr:hypothetical protein GYMLUDRAFT_46065 [Collybiopsis luxurians FD-317 M1]